MKKNLFFLIIFSIIFCTNLFAEQLVLERKVTNHVQRYYDKKWFDESGTVRIYVNEFTNTSGKKFGWAFAIESNMFSILKIVGSLFQCKKYHFSFRIADERKPFFVLLFINLLKS